MSLWNDIIKTATLGTNRAPLNKANAQDWEKEFVQENEGEANMLHIAAVRSVASRAGFVPQKYEGELPQVASEEDAPNYLHPEALYFLKNAEDDFLIKEFLHEINEINKTIPPDYLPNFLYKAVKNKLPQDWVFPVIGARGRWLVQQNEDWSKQFKEATEEDWEYGKINQRLIYFRELRKSEPDKARVLLEGTRSSESVGDLSKFLRTFEYHLSEKDNAILESLLSHKRKEIRSLAANYLMQIPESDLVQRMKERAEALLTYKKGKLLSKSKLTVKLPTLTKELEKDFVGDTLNIRGVGKKAGYLLQIIRCIPPQYWEGKFDVKATDLIKAAKRTDYDKVLLIAWIYATSNFKNAEWAHLLCQELIVDPKLADSIYSKVPKLFDLLDDEQRNGILQKAIKEEKGFAHNGPLLMFLRGSKNEINVNTTKKLFKKLKNALENQEKKRNYGLDSFVYELKNIYQIIPLSMLDEAIKTLSDIDTVNYLEKHIGEFLAAMEYRAKMLKAIKK